MPDFQGYDHIDCRVRSLAAVEAFYDRLMPELGLPEKRRSFVDAAGDWHDVPENEEHNTVEYYEPARSDRARFFMGLIERADHVAGLTRIAFRVSPERLLELEALLPQLGALAVERHADMAAYPAVFFEDPDGAKLEIVARLP